MTSMKLGSSRAFGSSEPSRSWLGFIPVTDSASPTVQEIVDISLSSTDWLVMCGNNKGVVFVGKDGKNIAPGHGPQLNADFHLYINEGFANEASDFGVMEVITWNRALSEDEMWTSMEYLNWKLANGSQ